jgi:hypothetical protein
LKDWNILFSAPILPLFLDLRAFPKETDSIMYQPNINSMDIYIADIHSSDKWKGQIILNVRRIDINCFSG